MPDEPQLTHESKEAIRHYLLKLAALPATVMMIASFLVGFFIKDVAQKTADLEAATEVSKITRDALAKVNGLTEEIYRDQAKFAEKVADKRAEATQTLEAIRSLSEEVKQLNTSVSLAKGVKSANDMTNQVARLLSKDSDFIERISKIADAKINDRLPVLHHRQWILEKETGEATSWAPLPTDMSLKIKSRARTLLIIGDISRVQHQSEQINTEYRLVVNGKPIATTNSGGHKDFDYKALTLLGVADVSPGETDIRVEYKTQSGVEYWGNSERGQQQRRLIVIELNKANGA